MRSYFLFTLIILSSFTIHSQWSNDPNNNLVLAIGWDPHIVSDSSGGCYITYNYDSFYPQKLAVERLDKYGYKPWGTLKQILGELPEQWQAEIIEDGEGGVIVSYQDNELNLPDFTTRVRVQKVDSNGNFLWGQTGVGVTTDESNQGSQSLVGDGDGGCIVVWTQLLTDYTYDFRANRINNMGERAWSDTGIYLENRVDSEPAQIVSASDGLYYVQTSTIYRINQNGQIVNQYYGNMLGQPVPDPEGGIVLTGVTGNIYNRKLVAQRKDSLGNNLWQEPYVEIADSLHINTIIDIRYSPDYYYYSWVGKKNGYYNRAQFQSLRKDGSLLFTNGSELLSSDSAISKIGIIPSYFSRTIFCWNIPGVINSTFSQLYDTLGNKHWDENGVIVAQPNILYQSFTTDGNGGFIIGGVVNNFTVVAQQVNRYGQLGQIITDLDTSKDELLPQETLLSQNYPNPFNSQTIIKYEIPKEERVRINLYNILGEKILTLFEGEQSSGYHQIILSSDGLSSGVYFYSLETISSIQINKLTIIK